MRLYFITDGETVWRVEAHDHDIAVLATYFGTKSQKRRKFIHKAPLSSRFEFFNREDQAECLAYSQYVTDHFEDVSHAVQNMFEIEFNDVTLADIGRFDPYHEIHRVIKKVNPLPL